MRETCGLFVGNDRFIRRNGKLFTREDGVSRPRFWDPAHSKLSALLHKKDDLTLPGVRNILYLGGGHGTTVSHLSDLLHEGLIFVVEFGITMEDVLSLTAQRKNIFPIMEDASIPRHFKQLIAVGSMDLLYQDIAQRHQKEILLANLGFLRKDGLFILMVKTRSIAQDGTASRIVDTIMEELSMEPGIFDLDSHGLEPYQKEHYAILGRKG